MNLDSVRQQKKCPVIICQLLAMNPAMVGQPSISSSTSKTKVSFL